MKRVRKNKEMREGKKKNVYVYVFLVVAVVFVVWSLFLVFGSSKPLKTQEFDVFFIVDVGGIGFDVNNTLLTFGQVNPGGGGERKVIIDNTYAFPLEVKTSVSKNLQGLLEIGDEELRKETIVQPGKNVTIPIKLNVPENFSLGNYTGKIKFEMFKA